MQSRRERIGERLRVLQELVPNGSKVDMVTMLDKAITYVKFMQLQLTVRALIGPRIRDPASSASNYYLFCSDSRTEQLMSGARDGRVLACAGWRGAGDLAGEGRARRH